MFTQTIGIFFLTRQSSFRVQGFGWLQQFYWFSKKILEIKCKITLADVADQRAETEVANVDILYFMNNSLHSLFSECTVSANGFKIYNTNGNYAHKGFIETEFSDGESVKNTSLFCQGSCYEDEPQKFNDAHTRATDVGERKELVAQLVEATFIGMPVCDILACDKLLLSGGTLQFPFRRSSNEFVTIA